MPIVKSGSSDLVFHVFRSSVPTLGLDRGSSDLVFQQCYAYRRVGDLRSDHPPTLGLVGEFGSGVVLAILTASFGVTGYSLSWDQDGYWVVKIITSIPEALPGIGLALGSASVGQSTLTRFYSLHIFVLPFLTTVFMLMYFLMIHKQGISGPL
ncbi:Cytochrome b6-like protein [Drosera capensis]